MSLKIRVVESRADARLVSTAVAKTSPMEISPSPSTFCRQSLSSQACRSHGSSVFDAVRSTFERY